MEVKGLLSSHIYNDILSIYNTEDFRCFRNKTVLITGAGRLTGYYLACAFLIGNDIDGNNTKVIAIDKEESLFEKYGRLNSRTDVDFFISKTYGNIPGEKTDYIIHTDIHGDRDYFEAVENLLNYAQQCENASVVLCSDADIYGSVYNGKSKLTETDSGYIDLANPDRYKIQCQRMAEAYGKKMSVEKGMNIKFARMCSVLGALSSSPLNRIVTAALVNKNGTAEKDMQYVTEDLSVIKSYGYVTDVASALLKILTEGKKGEAYNISTGCDTSLKYITEACAQLVPEVNVAYKSNSIINSYDISPMSSTRQIMDNSKLTGLGYKPKITLAEGIKRTVKIIEEVM